MARGRGRQHKTDVADQRRSTRRTIVSQESEDLPSVYQEMLQEEQAATTTSANDDERPLKKRRTARSYFNSSPAPTSEPGRSATHHIPTSSETRNIDVPATSIPSNTAPNDERVRANEAIHTSRQAIQTAYDSDESDDSDIEWEDALVDDGDSDEPGDDNALPDIADITITIGSKSSEPAAAKKKIRRRAITAVDKKKRLDIHKMHVVCLLYHVHRRNFWCNDLRVQTALRKLVPASILLKLVPDPGLTQYSASKRFIEGMNDLKTLWSRRFKLTAQGMYKPKWADADADVRPPSDFDDLDHIIDKDDFRNAAQVLQGSQDVGTQLFCALLRAIGIEARLVCSLQPLPFASSAQPSTPQKASTNKNIVTVDPYNKPTQSTSRATKKLSRLERVMGERHAVLHKAGVAPQKQKAYHVPYPVYWVEVFNTAHQKWAAIDTHSTFSVNAPEKLEPPLNSTQNSLTYAIAFEEDYTAKDVTRRYAKAYNAKTRKFRVECTPRGEDWWQRTMKQFRRTIPLDRDQVEDAALAHKEAAEGIPKNVQDFKDHPVYVLERHLKHNEVIHPLNQVGKVNVSSAMNAKIEPIYRRKDVHIVRSADKWYRMGYDVQEGEQPLKHAKPKKGRHLSIGPDMDMDEQQEEEIGAGLYADFQVELYLPPPVVRGRVPRNAYGNLDLYVPSMCPPGGTHVRHKLAAKAARILGVDYADAVTGFSFKGRHGTAIMQGIVVASEYAEAVQEVIDGMEYEQERAVDAARSRESLRLWKRFFLGLRITQRVNAIEIDGERGPMIDVQGEIDKEDKQIVEAEMAGGFFPDEADFAQSTTREEPTEDYSGGGFMVDDDDEIMAEGGGFVDEDEPAVARNSFKLNREHSFESSILDSQQLLPRRRSSFARDYILEESDEDDAGGFIRDESLEAGSSTKTKQTESTSTKIDGSGEIRGGFIPEDTFAVSAEDKTNNNQEMQIGNIPSEQESEPEVATGQIPEHRPPSPSSSLSDTGSLPLEDPEDEDADPDWLIEAT